MAASGKNRSAKKKHFQTGGKSPGGSSLGGASLGGASLGGASLGGVGVATAGVVGEAPELALLDHKPVPREGEQVEDVAIFASQARQQLSAELQTEAALVADSLDKIHRGCFESAMADVKGIPASSPYADWKLFVRGYIAFCQRDLSTAQRNWERLEPERRACRVAKSLLNASAPPEQVGTSVNLEDKPTCNLAVASSSEELLRQFLSCTGPLVAARRIADALNIKNASAFSVKQAKLLEGFSSTYRRAYPDFVNSFLQSIVRIIARQPRGGVLNELLKLATAPDFDPKWNLLQSFLAKRSEQSEPSCETYIKAYLETDLPLVKSLTEEVRSALKSICLFELGKIRLIYSMRQAVMDRMSPISICRKIGGDDGHILLAKAIEAYPKNREAHVELIRFLDTFNNLEMQLGEETDGREVFEAKANFVKHFPNEVETKLWLIDWYFDHDETDKAKSLVETIDFSQTEAPIVKAAKWKLLISEAFYAAKYKSMQLTALQSLEQTGNCWPAWLPRYYFDYFQAALDLRVGRKEIFEKRSRELASVHSLPDHVHKLLLYVSCSLMSVPAKETKTLKEEYTSIDIRKLPFEAKLDLAAIFWDLYRSIISNKICATLSQKISKEIQSALYMLKKLPSERSRVAALEWVMMKSPINSAVAGFVRLIKTNPTNPHMIYLLTQFAEEFQIDIETACLRDRRSTLEKALPLESDAFWYYQYKQALLTLSSVIAG
ncbi:MAG: hypothetical protein MUC43_19780, partial [Pirellula sp.]|nr:hypothetical protein [Pirellula sp.]